MKGSFSINTKRLRSADLAVAVKKWNQINQMGHSQK
jgi:hypothetical protein